MPDARVTCADGDPRCDFDGIANGSCRLHLAVCLDNHDPRQVAKGCAPSGVLSYEVLLRAHRTPDPVDADVAASLLTAITSLSASSVALSGATARIDPPLGVDRCSTYQAVTVPIGTRIIRIKARNTVGKTDGDTLRVRCTR